VSVANWARLNGSNKASDSFRRPKTFLAITTEGRKAFDAHVAALEAIIKPGGTK
jgi:hypothetical protein